MAIPYLPVSFMFRKATRECNCLHQDRPLCPGSLRAVQSLPPSFLRDLHLQPLNAAVPLGLGMDSLRLLV
jgi:hypothetical protein